MLQKDSLRKCIKHTPRINDKILKQFYPFKPFSVEKKTFVSVTRTWTETLSLRWYITELFRTNMFALIGNTCSSARNSVSNAVRSASKSAHWGSVQLRAQVKSVNGEKGCFHICWYIPTRRHCAFQSHSQLQGFDFNWKIWIFISVIRERVWSIIRFSRIVHTS